MSKELRTFLEPVLQKFWKKIAVLHFLRQKGYLAEGPANYNARQNSLAGCEVICIAQLERSLANVCKIICTRHSNITVVLYVYQLVV